MLLLFSNGKYTLIMQGDGNLVLYTNSNTPVWATTAVHASLQDDGNRVLYAKGVDRRFRRDVSRRSLGLPNQRPECQARSARRP